MTLQPHALRSPTLEEPYVYRRTETMWLPVWKDRDDSPLVSSTDLPLIKPMYEPFAVLCIHGIVYKDSFKDSDIAGLVDRVNADTWRGWGAGKAWISEINTDPENVNNQDVEKVHYVVRCLDRKWSSFAPDIGYQYKSGSSIASFLTTGGVPYIGKLDSDGGELDGDMRILEFEYKKEADFGQLKF